MVNESGHTVGAGLVVDFFVEFDIGHGRPDDFAEQLHGRQVFGRVEGSSVGFVGQIHQARNDSTTTERGDDTTVGLVVSAKGAVYLEVFGVRPAIKIFDQQHSFFSDGDSHR